MLQRRGMDWPTTFAFTTTSAFIRPWITAPRRASISATFNELTTWTFDRMGGELRLKAPPLLA